MKRIPRPVLRALEALAQSPINTSALTIAEGQDFAHDTLYRALNQPLAWTGATSSLMTSSSSATVRAG